MMAPLAKVFGGIGAVLVTFMLIGLVLPGTWAAEASIQIEAAPAEVFPFLNDLSRWDTWTNWGEIDSELSDPSPRCRRIPSVGRPEFRVRLGDHHRQRITDVRALRGGGRRWRFGYRRTQDPGSWGSEQGDMAGRGRLRA